jgi:hypothetical protein
MIYLTSCDTLKSVGASICQKIAKPIKPLLHQSGGFEAGHRVAKLLPVRNGNHKFQLVLRN